ncbi:MAG TPA: hypothetical protein VKE22_07470 [Haliangiales bacterium]|nr:hypothetical protein [Haliangiales bacterium]
MRLRASASLLAWAATVSAAPPPPAADVFSILPSQTTPPGSDPIGAPSPTPADRCSPDERPNRGHWLYAPLPHVDDPAVSPKLLVFLAGHYPNSISQSLLEVCDGSAGDCYWKHRFEVAFGEEKGSTASDIATCPEESIANRLRRVLDYLRQNNYPGWDGFSYRDDADQKYHVNWSHIAVAGHSGYAALLAKHRDVHRVVMLAEVADAWGKPAQPAEWIAKHVTDVYRRNAAIPAGAHRLESTRAVAPGVAPHFDVARNGPVYRAAWRHMLGKGD